MKYKFLFLLFVLIFYSCNEKKEIILESIEINEMESENGQYFNDFEQIITETDDVDEKLVILNQNISMNDIDITSLTFIHPNGSLNEILFIDNDGNYRFVYGINTVIVNFWNKNIEFDRNYQWLHNYYPNEFIEMENNIFNGTNDFPNIFFNTNIRKNEINDIIFIDSFLFSAFEAEDIGLIYIFKYNTNKYNIRIQLFSNRELVNLFIKEAPKYFKIRTSDGDIEFSDEVKDIGRPVWDFRNNAIEMFGNDLLNGIHDSKIVNDWFKETEEILNGIIIN